MYWKLAVFIFLAFVAIGGQRQPSTTPTPAPTPTPEPTPEPTPTSTVGTSGIRGTTLYMVVSGVPGGETTGGPASIEFAIAPVEDGVPAYDRAIFVTSDAQGLFQVELAPGSYWLGPKAKALDPVQYVPGPEEFTEVVVGVEAGAYTAVELVQTGYAP